MDDEEEQLRSLALRSAQTILSARQRTEEELRKTKEELEERSRVLELLNKTGAIFASNLDIQALVQAVTDAATELSGADFGAFFYTAQDADGGVLTLFTLSGAPREAFESLGHPRATALFAPTFAGQGVIRIANVREDPRYGSMAPHHGMPPGHLPVCSYMAVPVSLRAGEVIGVLLFGHREPNVFSEREERIIVGISGQAAIAIDNARMYAEAKRMADVERASRAEIERISLMKDEFLATLSHELRTPLNAVLGWTEVLLSRSGADAEAKRGLGAILRNAQAQAQLIEDLLDMNRIVSGKIRLDIQRADLMPIIAAAVESVRPSVEAKGIRLRTLLDPLAGPVSADPERLQQVVWNLLSNALKFTPKGGRIDVLLQRVNSHVEITVTDSGSGINADFLPFIFDRFRQADSSTTRRHGGLGLGLSIVKQLVELHGGSVHAESGGEQQGASFVVRLPVRAIREEDKREHPSTRAPAIFREETIDLAGLTLLLVDDDWDARELLGIILTAASAQVVSAASAAEGLTLLKSRKPNLIVSDIGMPDCDGYQFMRAVRALSAADGGKTPAIALTAFARSEDRTRALLAGYQAHIAKPIEGHELVVTIASLTGRTF